MYMVMFQITFPKYRIFSVISPSLISGIGYRYKRTKEEEIFDSFPFRRNYNEKFANAYVYGALTS